MITIEYKAVTKTAQLLFNGSFEMKTTLEEVGITEEELKRAVETSVVPFIFNEKHTSDDFIGDLAKTIGNLKKIKKDGNTDKYKELASLQDDLAKQVNQKVNIYVTIS